MDDIDGAILGKCSLSHSSSRARSLINRYLWNPFRVSGAEYGQNSAGRNNVSVLLEPIFCTENIPMYIQIYILNNLDNFTRFWFDFLTELSYHPFFLHGNVTDSKLILGAGAGVALPFSCCLHTFAMLEFPSTQTCLQEFVSHRSVL